MNLSDFQEKTDQEWYRSLFSFADLKRLSSEEVASIIDQSMSCAQKVYQEFGSIILNQGIEAAFSQFGTQIKINSTSDTVNLIAFYEKDSNSLTLYTIALENFYQRIAVAGLNSNLNQEKLRLMVLSHEFYHTVEMNIPGTYTYRKILPRKFLGIHWQKRIIAASEIGAYEFAREVIKLPFNPLLLEET